MRHFWKWVTNETGRERTLYLEGAIADETWWGDETTPKMFRQELNAGEGNITVWINSPGGDVEAAAQIYNMLREYDGEVTVKIDGVAASAASVVAMAGTKVMMSPVSMLMIHNPTTFVVGDAEEMTRAKDMLDEYKQSIINAYQLKTGLSRVKLAHLMDAETWMNAHKAVELGFADEIMYTGGKSPQPTAPAGAGRGLVFSRLAVANSLIDKVTAKAQKTRQPQGTPIDSLDKRLSCIIH